MNIFEKATRGKLRFLHKGIVTTEDLWDLSLTDLDGVFKKLNSELKTMSEDSLLGGKSKESEVLELKIEIVKYIVDVKLKEKSIKDGEKLVKIQQQKIMQALANKEDEELQNKSAEELREMLKNIK